MKNNEKLQILKRIGQKIRENRIEKGLSQEKLGFLSGLDRTYIGSVERGERNISILNLHRIAQALEIDLVKLLKV